MSIEIKLLRRGDETQLARVAPGVFDDPVDAAAAQEFLADERHHLAVAIDGGVVIGFVSAVLYVHPDKPRRTLINEVGVAAAAAQGAARPCSGCSRGQKRAAPKRGCSPTTRTRVMTLCASLGGEEAAGAV
jgi:hypothetical protein